MPADDDFEDYLESLPPMTPDEQSELLLTHLTQMLAVMEVKEVDLMRRFVRMNCPPGPGRDTLEELLEGHLALRQLSESA